MLGPFRIRNLRRPLLPSHPSSAKIRSYDAVVSLTGQEYDRNVYRHPESKLKYLDQDDGEVITVGSQIELAQRLQEPVSAYPRCRTAQYESGDHSNRSYNPLSHLSKAETMHVFEVDREGDSIKIWEEIEDRTRALLPRVETTKSAVTAESSVHANAVESMAEQHNHRPELHNKYLPKPQIDYLRDDDLSVQMDESDDTSRLQELREDRDRRTPGAHISIEGLMDDMRTHWFHASNPPKLPSEPAMDTENASHHKKSMRLSDVLNDVEPEQAANEAAPLLGSFHEGNLTAEGRRQAMEAGNRMRLRTNPIRHSRSLKTVKEARHQAQNMQDHNRWASYNSRPTSAFTTPNSRPVDPAPVPAQEPIEIPKIDHEAEGSLLQTFRAELAKITRPDSQHVPKKSLTEKLEADLPKESTLPDGYLQATTRKLVLQSITSIISNATTLTSQIRDHVTTKMITDNKLALDIQASEEPQNAENVLRGILAGFERSVTQLANTLEESSSNEQNIKWAPLKPDNQAVGAAVNSLYELTSCFDKLSRGLSSVDALEHVRPVHEARKILNEAKDSSIGGRTDVCIYISPIPANANWIDIKDHIYQVVFDVVGDRCSVSGVSIYSMKPNAPRTAICSLRGEDEQVKLIIKELSRRQWEGCRPYVAIVGTVPEQPQPSRDSEWRFGASIRSDNHEDHAQINPTVAEVPRPNGAGSERANIAHQPSSRSPPSRVISTLPEPTLRTVRFVDEPTQEKESSAEVQKFAKKLEEEFEQAKRPSPGISFRHIPSPLPCDPEARGRSQGHETSRSHRKVPYVYVPPAYRQPKSRPFSMAAPRWHSRSRSRSPVRHVSRRSSELHRPLPPKSQPQASYVPPQERSFRPTSKSEVRDVQAFPEAVNPERGDNPGYGSIPPGRQAYAQLRSYGAAAERPTARQFNQPSIWHSPSYNDLRRGSHETPNTFSTYPEPHATRVPTAAAALLRHSKSMSAIRKLPTRPMTTEENKAHGTYDERNKRLSNPVGVKASYQPGQNPELAADCFAEDLNRFDGSQDKSPLVTARLPSLEQFENKKSSAAPQFPPLPSMEPLVPSRPNAPKAETKVPENQEDSAPFAKAMDPTQPKVYPSAWLQRGNSSSDTESSGDFFRRMTGLGQSPPSPVSPMRLGAAAPGARLVRPFDPQAETATIHRHQLMEGVRRSATVSGLHDRFAAGPPRRPYSAYFDGSGRVEWDSFLRESAPPPARASSSRIPRVAPEVPTATRPQSRLPVRTSMPPRVQNSDDERERNVPAHHDPKTVGLVQTCVEELKKLGFGSKKDGGVERLIVYAQAAEGNLGDAIDLIEEEREAYAERT